MTTSYGTAGRAAPNRWWSDRWAWRGAIAAAPLGALLAIVYALVVLRLAPTEALLAYLLGAAVASGVGCVLAGPLGASVETFRHSRRRSQDEQLVPSDEADAQAGYVATDDDTVGAVADDDVDAVADEDVTAEPDSGRHTYAGAA